MTTRKKILVTGGAGYIGSHTIIDLLNHGYDVVSVDNYCRSSAVTFDRIEEITGIRVPNYVLDICSETDLYTLFDDHPDIAGIIHFAALKSVNESVALPILYYENNLYSLLNILKAMTKYHIHNLVFSSSCSVYGNVQHLPVNESTPLAKPECAYAATKQMGEQMVEDFIRANQGHAILLRYFNPVGAHASGKIGEVPYDKPNNLVPVITQTAVGMNPNMFVWGHDYDTRDGTCIRDYIHVMDIAHAHTLALGNILESTEKAVLEIFNLGSGQGVSVLEAIQSFEKVSGVKLNYELGPRRDGDVIAIYADNSYAKQKLQWNPERSIEEMMRSAWEWQLQLSALANK